MIGFLIVSFSHQSVWSLRYYANPRVFQMVYIGSYNVYFTEMGFSIFPKYALQKNLFCIFSELHLVSQNIISINLLSSYLELLLTGIACLLNKMNRPEVTVGVDGSLYRFHPHFHDLMMEKIQQLLNPGLKVSD